MIFLYLKIYGMYKLIQNSSSIYKMNNVLKVVKICHLTQNLFEQILDYKMKTNAKSNISDDFGKTLMLFEDLILLFKNKPYINRTDGWAAVKQIRATNYDLGLYKKSILCQFITCTCWNESILARFVRHQIENMNK